MEYFGYPSRAEGLAIDVSNVRFGHCEEGLLTRFTTGIDYDGERFGSVIQMMIRNEIRGSVV